MWQYQYAAFMHNWPLSTSSIVVYGNLKIKLPKVILTQLAFTHTLFLDMDRSYFDVLPHVASSVDVVQET